MAPRIAMTIVADGEGDTVVATPGGRFHALIIVEGIDTGDKRHFVENSLTWRDLPFALHADDKQHFEHEDSVLVGNFDTIERQGTEIHGWGDYLDTPSPEAAYLISLIQSGELRGISADVDMAEYEILWPIPDEAVVTNKEGDTSVDEEAIWDQELPIEEVDGKSYEVMPIEQPIQRVTQGRIMGATAVTFPAFQEAWIEDDSGSAALAASAASAIMAEPRITGVMLTPLVTLVAAGRVTFGATTPGREAAPARFSFPDIPPAEWFDVPETPGPMPLTILDSGQVFGHLALWGECHIGLTGECVEPPKSPSNYARFHLGEIPVDDGGRVTVGHLTFSTGHADMHLKAGPAKEHYDETGSVAADIVASDGEYGIWCCGAARSTLSVAQIREVMSAPPSGDWRQFGRNLDMVAALCVNVPGFQNSRGGMRVRREEGLVASLVMSHPAPEVGTELTGPMAVWARSTFHKAGYFDEATAGKIIDRLAASIGRSREQRIAALTARVHGGRDGVRV